MHNAHNVNNEGFESLWSYLILFLAFLSPEGKASEQKGGKGKPLENFK
jgi:hypothetical protein